MPTLTFLVPLVLAVSAGKPIVSKPIKSTPTKVEPAAAEDTEAEPTEEQKTLAEVALARRLPRWVGATQRKQLLPIVKLLRENDVAGARAAWEAFVKAHRAKHDADEFDLVARWAVRQAYFADQKELDEAAYRLGRVLRLEAELEVYAAELQAIQIADGTKQRVEVRSLDGDALGPKKAVKLDRSGLSNTIKELESTQEDVRNRRRMATNAFQNFDQKTNQLYDLLSSVQKAMSEMRMGIVRNML